MSSSMTEYMGDATYRAPHVDCIKCGRGLTIRGTDGKRYEKPGFYALDGSGPYCHECRKITNWNFINPDLSWEQHMREMQRDPKYVVPELREVLKR